jgi:DNA-binding NtrC family response regulator
MAASILVYGHDPLLLETRRIILERAGFAVHTTTKFEEFKATACTRAFDLLVLGSSISPDEVDRILPMIHQCVPFSKVLVLANGALPPPLNSRDEVLSALAGPNALIDQIGKMLEVRGRKPAASAPQILH